MPGLDEVIKARAEEGEGAIEDAESYVEKLIERLGAISAAVFGSYARGEFNLWSDIDVIVAPQKFKDVDFIRKCPALLDAPPKIGAICWTPEEAAKALKALVDRGPQKLHNPPDDYGVFTMCQTRDS